MADYPDEGMNAGMPDFRVRTLAEEKYWDGVGFTATGPYGENPNDEPEPSGMGMDMDDMRRRPTWMPEVG